MEAMCEWPRCFDPHNHSKNSRIPYITLNISSTIALPTNTSTNSLSKPREPVIPLFIQFRCLHSLNKQDPYCHRNPAQQVAKWGRMVWPCRRLTFSALPTRSNATHIHFSYDCFHLFGHSTSELNFTLHLSSASIESGVYCQQRLIFTIPATEQLDPALRRFYSESGKQPPLHDEPSRPLVWVDVSRQREVRVHFYFMRDAFSRYDAYPATLALFRDVGAGRHEAVVKATVSLGNFQKH